MDLSYEKDIPVSSCRFKVVFNYRFDMRFSKVSGIHVRYKVQNLMEGGRNKDPLMLRCPKEEATILTFERGVFPGDLGGLFSLNGNGAIKRFHVGEIFVYGENNNVARAYSFETQGIIEYKVSDLDAMSSNVLIDTLVVSVCGLKQI